MVICWFPSWSLGTSNQPEASSTALIPDALRMRPCPVASHLRPDPSEPPRAGRPATHRRDPRPGPDRRTSPEASVRASGRPAGEGSRPLLRSGSAGVLLHIQPVPKPPPAGRFAPGFRAGGYSVPERAMSCGIGKLYHAQIPYPLAIAVGCACGDPAGETSRLIENVAPGRGWNEVSPHRVRPRRVLTASWASSRASPSCSQQGLEGAAESAIATVGQESVGLRYRGYSAVDLAEGASFEEVAYLLVHGEPPGRQALEAYRERLAGLRPLPEALYAILRLLPADAHPMDVLRTGCSALGTLEPEASVGRVSAPFLDDRISACRTIDVLTCRAAPLLLPIVPKRF